jgi:hypothetical protein
LLDSIEWLTKVTFFRYRHCPWRTVVTYVLPSNHQHCNRRGI